MRKDPLFCMLSEALWRIPHPARSWMIGVPARSSITDVRKVSWLQPLAGLAMVGQSPG
jgi:hypothetical protein